MRCEAINRLGRIIVGNEILNGRRQDKHFHCTMELCREWNAGVVFEANAS